jgi:hypothetical protein
VDRTRGGDDDGGQRIENGLLCGVEVGTNLCRSNTSASERKRSSVEECDWAFVGMARSPACRDIDIEALVGTDERGARASW